MSVTVKIDDREFRRVARLLRETSSRSTTQFVNGQMFAVANRAIKLTNKADASKIERQLRTIQSNNFGKIRKGDWQRLEGTLAARIINARRKARGERLLFGREMGEEVNRMVGGRKRSVSFVASGWIPALVSLGRRIFKGGAMFGARMRGRPKGRAMPAVHSAFRFSTSCTIENSALLTEGKFTKGGRPMQVAEIPLAKAVNETTRDMSEQYLKRMGVDLRPYGVTVA